MKTIWDFRWRSGQDWRSATTQALKSGAKMMIAHSVARLNCDSRPYKVSWKRIALATRSIVIEGAQVKQASDREPREI